MNPVFKSKKSKIRFYKESSNWAYNAWAQYDNVQLIRINGVFGGCRLNPLCQHPLIPMLSLYQKTYFVCNRIKYIPALQILVTGVLL